MYYIYVPHVCINICIQYVLILRECDTSDVINSVQMFVLQWSTLTVSDSVQICFPDSERRCSGKCCTALKKTLKLYFIVET